MSPQVDRPLPSAGRSRTTAILLAFLAVTIPFLTWWLLPQVPAIGNAIATKSGGTQYPQSKLSLRRASIGSEPGQNPQITHVQVVDFDDDGRNDVIACDAQRSSVLWYRQTEDGSWDERVLGDQLIVPAHATVVDLDQDGDRDVLVSILGNIWPDDGVIGRLVLLENLGGQFQQRILLDDIRRVADAQADDLDGDGDLDLAVAEFGYAHGSVMTLENVGGLQFRERELIVAPGAIHVQIADYDGDGDRDVATIISQDEEELWGFENLGNWEFRARRLFWTPNFDLGSAGLVQSDLDADGDQDLLLPVGDNFEDQYAYPQPYHGCLWFENRGGWEFVERRLANFGGTYAAAVGDLDADGDRDVVLVSMSNDWDRAENPSIAWLENDGQQNFTPWQIASDPIHLVTVACGDIDNDGRDDVVAGGLHVRPPFDRRGRITAWHSRGATAPP